MALPGARGRATGKDRFKNVGEIGLKRSGRTPRMCRRRRFGRTRRAEGCGKHVQGRWSDRGQRALHL